MLDSLDFWLLTLRVILSVYYKNTELCINATMSPEFDIGGLRICRVAKLKGYVHRSNIKGHRHMLLVTRSISYHFCMSCDK